MEQAGLLRGVRRMAVQADFAVHQVRQVAPDWFRIIMATKAEVGIAQFLFRQAGFMAAFAIPVGERGMSYVVDHAWLSGAMGIVTGCA